MNAALLLPLLLTAAPVTIETLGFSVAVEAGTVVVVKVTPGSPAARAGVAPRTTIERVFAPRFRFAMGPLAELSPTDLHDALTPSHDEELIFTARRRGTERMFTLSRTDPRPAQRFSEIPLPPEMVARLSIGEQVVYNATLISTLNARADAARPKRPILALSRAVEATVDERGVSLVVGGSSSPEWIYFSGYLRYTCPGAAMRSMELVGPAPFPKVTASSTDAHREGGQVEVQLPLWRIVDAVEACKGRRSTLPSVVLTGTLRCEGLAPLTVEVSAPLALTCAPAAKAFGPRWDALRVRSAETLVTGPNAPTTVSVWWDVLRPTPRAVTVVELDDGGAVLTRHQALTPSSALNAGNSEAFVRLDTSRPRVVSLALELAFPDGSIALSAPQTVSIVTPAQREADLERSAALSRRMTEVHDQLNQAFTNPCSNPDAAVIWLNIQPGVSQATNFEGHNLSYLVGGRPVVLMCHDLWSR